MNDMSDAPRFYARKGEHVTCVNGHTVCEFARDIAHGDGRSADDFTNWQQPQPDHKTSVAEIRCTECRGVWIRGNTSDGYQFHFADGWR